MKQQGGLSAAVRVWVRRACTLTIVGIVLPVFGGAQAHEASVALTSEATILVDAQQPVPVQRAAQDLAADMQAVFGRAPRIVATEGDTGAVSIVLGEEATGAPANHEAAAEAFSITSGTVPRASGGNRTVIRLAGSDMRGTLFAIYQFSQDYLGVDPMYYWTDHPPTPQKAIQISRALDRKYAPPVFRYRGIFINDEDLLTGWAPGEAKDKTGISLAVWNKLCETVLRLKGNMIVAGTWPFADEPQDHLVAERGLLLNQHHAEPLGVNFSRWPQKVPFNYTSDPQYIENAWKNAVAAYPKDQEILWELGLRGLSDEPYSALDPSVRGDEKAQGHLISKALAEQMKIVRARYPKAVFITDLWMEGNKLMQQGDLVIPKDVITVWADTGYGDIRDAGQASAGQGAYVHVAMYNGKANQLSELTPVSRMYASLGRFEKAGATAFLLVNTSDLRPVTMGARAVLDFGWKGEATGSSDAFYSRWATEEFGAKAAPAVAEVYKAYFEAPAMLAGTPATPYGDNYYHSMARDLLRSVMVQWPTYGLPGQSPIWTEPSVRPVPFDPNWASRQAQKEADACGAAQIRWDGVWKQALAAEPLVASDRKPFYQAGVLTMIAINRESNHLLLALSQAVMAMQRGDHAAAEAKTAEALEAAEAIKAAEAKAEYGIWKNWYRGDWLTGVERTRELLQDFAMSLKDPNAPLPPPLEWSNWEAYYHIQHYQGMRTVDVQ